MKLSRIPNEEIYDVFLTFILGFTLLIAIYALVPVKHSCIYFTKL